MSEFNLSESAALLSPVSAIVLTFWYWRALSTCLFLNLVIVFCKSSNLCVSLLDSCILLIILLKFRFKRTFFVLSENIA
jgi:hypothetical protein